MGREQEPISFAAARKLLGTARVQRMLTRIAQREMESRRDPNVLAVGVSQRRKGEEQRRSGVPVVRFVVARKLSQSELAGTEHQKVPEFISTRFTHEGKRYVTLVPTDVVEQPPLTFMARSEQPAGDHVAVTGCGGPGELGSICCLVSKPRTGTLYLLSCNHVFGRLLLTPDFTGGLCASIEFRNGAQKVPDVASISMRRDIAAISHARTREGAIDLEAGFDAALALVSQNRLDAVSSIINGRNPRRFLRSLSDIADGDTLILASPFREKTVVVEATYPGKCVLPFTTPGSGTIFVPFRQVVQYKGAGNDAPEGGDSGAAVLDAHGNLLVGMHFGGSGGKGYAMFAAELFRTDEPIFAEEIKLRTNHNA